MGGIFKVGENTAEAKRQANLSAASATLAGHYANDSGNTDVPGGASGDRGAKYWAQQAASNGGAAADRVNRALPVTRNRFDKDNTGFYFDGQAISAYTGGAGGVLVTSAGSLSVFIPVVDGETITVTGGYDRVVGFSGAGVANYAIANSSAPAGGSFTVPSGQGVQIVGISFNKSYASLATIDVRAGTRNFYKPFALITAQEAQAAASNGARRVLPPTVDLARRDGNTANGQQVTANTGAQASTGSNLYATDFIPVEEGRGLAIALRIYPSGSYAAANSGWAWFDENKQPLKVPAAGGGCALTYTSNGTNQISVTAFSSVNTYPTIGMPITGPDIPANSYITSTPGYGVTGTYGISQAATGSAAGQTGGAAGTLPGVLQQPPPGARFGRITCINGNIGGTSEDWRERHIVRDVDFSADLDGRNSGAIGFDHLAQLYPWRGKNLGVLGDSIVTPGDVSQPGVGGIQCTGMEQMLAAKGVLFGASGGRRMAEIFAGASTGLWARGSTSPLVAADLASIDVLWLHIGTNDWGIWNGTGWTPYRSGGLGSITDTGTTTFYGDIYNMITTLRGSLAYAGEIKWTTPFPRFDHSAAGDPANTLGLNLSQYVDAILAWVKAYGPRYGVRAHDLFRASRIHANNQASLMWDGLHPNQAGWRAQLPSVARFINAL